MSRNLGPKLPILLDQIARVRPDRYIEIGCYRCETMRDVAALGIDEIIGFDLFDTAPWAAPLDGPPLTREGAARHAGETGWRIVCGDTRETLAPVLAGLPEAKTFVFLDGGHDYEIAVSDWINVERFLPGAVTVFDDVTYPGVAQVIREIPAGRKKWLGYSMIRVSPP